jgi:hypothetical protein
MIEYTYTIADHWLCPLINDDYSGLEDDEVKELEDFINSLPKHYHFKTKMISTWDIKEEEPFFAKDDVSGLHANCHNVTLMYF